MLLFTFFTKRISLNFFIFNLKVNFKEIIYILSYIINSYIIWAL